MREYTVVCDKCNVGEMLNYEDVTEDTLPEGWLSVEEHGDLCPDCANDFDKLVNEWIEEEK